MDDSQFLSYVDLHSQTPRALFNRDDVTRLYKLAFTRIQLEEWENQEVKFFAVPFTIAEPLLAVARKHIADEEIRTCFRCGATYNAGGAGCQICF